MGQAVGTVVPAVIEIVQKPAPGTAAGIAAQNLCNEKAQIGHIQRVGQAGKIYMLDVSIQDLHLPAAEKRGHVRVKFRPRLTPERVNALFNYHVGIDAPFPN